MKSSYLRKIISIKKLSSIIKKLSKKEKTILCHGNFDVVHPGHIRHLNYAKSKADILVVSITSDINIKKGNYRPFVPENLRAQSLAAFEMVDYVLIDRNEKPLSNLKILKPDYFAKGFEYNSGSLPKATKEEAEVVESYGGEMIFTPGDIVYSSTQLLNLSQPKIDNFKLINLMKTNKITFQNLKDSLKNLKNSTVHVIGDTIVDTYTNTNLIGGNTKTPTPSLHFLNKTNYVGGAAIVAKHIRSTGAKVCFTTVLGNDSLKNFVIEDLKKAGIKVNAIIDKTRPTTNKNTIVCKEYKMLKIDNLDNHPISEKITKQISKFIKNEKNDIVIFSDFRHGVFNKTSIPIFIKSINKNSLKVADSQVATRWGNILDFKDFDLITPNEREVRFSLADQDSNLSELTRNLIKQAKFKNLILKLGEKGLFAVNNSEKQNYSFTIPTFVKNLNDAVGAGDALLSYASLSLLTSKSLVVAAILGSFAAACSCEINGNETIKPEAVLLKMLEIEDSLKYKIK